VTSASPIAAALGVGIALAGAPGPVQAVLLSESVRGGVPRGLRALAGSSLTFGVLLTGLTLGISVATPGGAALRILKGAGGALLLWLAFDGLRSANSAGRPASERRGLPPIARGSMAIVLNPGAWLFLAAVASPLLASAQRDGGKASAFVAALALLVGAGTGDLAVVLLGGLGVRRAGHHVELWTRRVLAIVLFGLGVWLLVQSITS
jgi:threonine/homoserine/homoserine lactone efflux protein